MSSADGLGRPLLVNFTLALLLALPLLGRALTAGRHQSSAEPSLPKAVAEEVTSSGLYSTNAICRRRNCVNPLFPGYYDLPRLGKATWQCASLAEVRPYLDFCADVVQYNPAIVSPGNKSENLSTIVFAQEAAAAKTFFLHASALKFDAWAFRSGEERTPCGEAVRKMACLTHFPMAEAGCKVGESSTFVRPCSNVCESYLNACDVQCCDESSRCVFDRNVSLASGATEVRHGYVRGGLQASGGGRAEACSGLYSAARQSRPVLSWVIPLLAALAWSGTSGSPTAARRISARQRSGSSLAGAGRLLAAVSAAAAAFALQGCDVAVPVGHAAANWESQPSLFTRFSYQPPGESISKAVLNSCSLPNLTDSERCGGHGVCVAWNTSSRSITSARPLRFCRCTRDWADPECQTRRKSQTKAFLLACFGGFLGLDQFYLGAYSQGLAKLTTVGGLGVWWIYDLVRIGSSPVYAGDSQGFRVAADLPHAIYVLIALGFGVAVGVFAFGAVGSLLRRRNHMSKLMMMAEDEFFRTSSAKLPLSAERLTDQPIRSNFRHPRPVPRGPSLGQKLGP